MILRHIEEYCGEETLFTVDICGPAQVYMMD
jgi:hypothetical protein